MAEIEEEQHQHRGQPRVPHPLGAHIGLPHRAGDQRDEGEQAPSGEAARATVGERVAPDQSDGACHRQDA